ncbi:MAG: glycosyl hydrolase family 28 protein [Planctomycetia bacterium]|nr:glycosyl hydrolase family 28 protein [Planctomycetia bacterium]
MRNKSFFKAYFQLTVALTALFLTTYVRGDVYTVSAPDGHAATDSYRVLVNGHEISVYRTPDQEEGSGEYYFATFEFDGEVTVEIKAPFSLAKSTVAPERYGVVIESLEENNAVLHANEPFMVSFEPNGRVKPLILFGLAPEIDAPHEGDENVVFFGPGEHSPGVVNLTDNQTLYVAAGAVVNGGVVARGDNITIRGRGVLSGANWKRYAGPTSFIINALDCKRLLIRDVLLREPWSWSCVLNNCEDVVIDGLRICASNMINDDALDICNSRRVEVRNCFFRAQDDSIAIKGIRKDHASCEDITIHDCTFWTDRANVFRIGYECEAKQMRNIVARNIDVLYYSVNYREHDHYWANAIVWLQPNQELVMSDCHFEDFRIRSNGDSMIMLMAKPMSCHYGDFENPVPGRLCDCSLSRFNVYGDRGSFGGELYFAGATPSSNVRGIKVSDFNYFGEGVKRDSPCVVVGDFVEDLEVK